MFEYQYKIHLETFNDFRVLSSKKTGHNYLVFKKNICKLLSDSDIKLSVKGNLQKTVYTIIDFDEYNSIIKNENITDDSIVRSSAYMKKLFDLDVSTNVKNLDAKIKMVS